MIWNIIICLLGICIHYKTLSFAPSKVSFKSEFSSSKRFQLFRTNIIHMTSEKQIKNKIGINKLNVADYIGENAKFIVSGKFNFK